MQHYEKIINIAIQRGFFLPSFEIYGTIGGFYDYGPIGLKILNKMKNLWREKFLYSLENSYEIQTSLFLPQKALLASGHIKNFADPVVFCKKEKKAFRADHLLNSALDKQGIETKTHLSLEDLKEKLKKAHILCPDCGGELSEPILFNLMFSTQVGAIDPQTLYLRPETAQGIFLDFKRIFLQSGAKLPIAIGQIGSSFRNEISPRKGLIRMREFQQMELEYFFNPNSATFYNFDQIAQKILKLKTNDNQIIELSAKDAIAQGLISNQIMAALLVLEQELFYEWGINPQKFWFRILSKDELPHYSASNIDAEFESSFGILEISGTSYRTDFDLLSHQKYSSEDLSVLDESTNKKFIPHVIEPSIGLDRSFFCILESCFREKSATKEWDWFSFPTSIAPYLVAVFPLMKKDNLDEFAYNIYLMLKRHKIDCYYSDRGSIGKRYARADEIGVPFCITIDYDSKQNNDVTIRYRDNAKQERVPLSNLTKKLIQLEQENKTSL